MINPFTKQETIIDDNYINAQINVVGAKFNQKQKLLNSPEKIKEIITIGAEKVLESSKDIPWIRNGKQKRCIFSIDFTPELKKNLGLDPDIPMGFGNIIEVDKKLEPFIFNKPRGGKEEADQQITKFIKSSENPATNKVVAVFAWFNEKENPQIFAVHPGIIAPPFPNTKFQSTEEFNYNKQFWDRHAFVENKDIK